MGPFLRAMVIPFFVALFPTVWYVNRNLTTERLPPAVEPTTELITVALGGAVVGSLVFAAAVARLSGHRLENESHAVPYRQRVLQPDGTALVVFFSFIFVSFIWALTEMAGFGPAWLGELLQLLLTPLAIPLLLFTPLAIHFHWAVIGGLVLCVLWMSLLGTILSDILHRRSLPLPTP